MSPSPLFRPESLVARRQGWLGRPIILHTIPVSIFAAFSVVFVIAVIAFLAFGEYTRRVRVSGVILPMEGLTRMVAPQSGWITDLNVQEGDHVARGAVLYTLGIDITSELGDTQGAVSDLLRDKRDQLRKTLRRQTEINAAEKHMLGDQAAALRVELPQIDAQLDVLKDFTQQLKDFADRQQDMLKRGVAISSAFETRLQVYNSQRSDLARLRRERVQLQGKLNELDDQLAQFDLLAAARNGDIERQILDIEQQIAESEARRAVRITAPRNGTVTGIITRAGQTVAAGTPLLTIVPTDRPLVAQLLAPSNAIGFVREGADVLLRYEAFPYQKFGQYPAHVSVISRANLRPEEVMELNAGGIDPRTLPTLYRITVTPDEAFVTAYGRQEPLQAGMQVEAHLFVDTRPLYQWILEPIYGLKGAVTSSGQPASGT